MSAEIAGIVGDADLYCVPCARKQYGNRAINAVLSGVWHGRPIDALNGRGPRDREGNVLGGILSDSEDLIDLDGPADREGRHGPRYCGDCGAALVEDSREWARRDADGQLEYYAWPGGYPLYYYSSEGYYCPDCASQTDADPKIAGADINYEDPDLVCDGCGRRIESAYAEPDDDDTDDDAESWQGIGPRIKLHPFPAMGCQADDDGTCYQNVTQDDKHAPTDQRTCARCRVAILFRQHYWHRLDDGASFCTGCVSEE